MLKVIIILVVTVLTVSIALLVCNVSYVDASQDGTVYGSSVIVYSDQQSVGKSFQLYTKYEFSNGYSIDSTSTIIIESGQETLNITQQRPAPDPNDYTEYTVGVLCLDPNMIVEVYGVLYGSSNESLWLTSTSSSGNVTHSEQFDASSLPSLKIYVSSSSESYVYAYPVSIVSGVLTNKTLLFNGFSINGNKPNPVEVFTSPPSTYILSGQDYVENVTSLKLLFNDTYITTSTDTLNLEVTLRVVIDGVLYEVFNGYDTSFDMSQFVFGETGITINSSNYSFYEGFITKFEGSYITSAQMQVEALQNGDYRYTINVYMESRLWPDNYYSGAIVLVKDIFMNVMDVLSVDILPNISVLDIFGVVVFVGFAFFIFKLLGY